MNVDIVRTISTHISIFLECFGNARFFSIRLGLEWEGDLWGLERMSEDIWGCLDWGMIEWICDDGLL